MKFSEGFATSFKKRTVGSAATSPAGIANQNTPGQIYNTETGFFNSLFPATNGLNLAGLADSGTRLFATFRNIPAGVSLFVTVTPVAPGTSTTGITARLISTDTTGAGVYSPVPATVGPYAQVPIGSGSGVVVWEVLDPSPVAAESLSFGLVVSYAANTPPAGQAAVSGDLAPINNSSSSSTAPLPRFVQASTPAPAFTIAYSTLAITNSSPLPAGIAGAPCSQQLTATGGLQPYAWSLPEGRCPTD